MDKESIQQFQNDLNNDPEMRSMLEQESGVEALLLNNIGTSRSDIRYSSLVDKTLEKASPMLNATKSPLWLRIYAIAATLIMMVLGGGVVFNLLKPGTSVLSEKTSIDTVYIHKDESEYTGYQQNKNRKNVPAHSSLVS